MSEIVNFPMNIYVRYVDIYFENGDILCRRFPITSVTNGQKLVGALQNLGFLPEGDNWNIQNYGPNGFYDFHLDLWFIRELLWINDITGSHSGYVIYPCEWGQADGEIGEEEPDYGPNVIEVDFMKGRAFQVRVQILD